MEINAFDAGVEPGGLRNTTDIRLLVCYLIRYCGAPVKREPVVNSLQYCGLANYFELNEAFIDLEERKIIKQSDGVFSLTASGDSIVDSIGFDLPKTVREKAVIAVLQYMEAERQERENVVKTRLVEHGSMVKCVVGDNIAELLNIEILVPDKKMVQTVKDNFHKNAGMIYKVVVAAMLGDCEMTAHALEELYDFGLEK